MDDGSPKKILILDRHKDNDTELMKHLRRRDIVNIGNYSFYFIETTGSCSFNNDDARIKCCNKANKFAEDKVYECNGFDYIIWHPGKKNTVGEYRELYDKIKEKNENIKIIFASSGADWQTVKETKLLIYSNLESIFKDNNIDQINMKNVDKKLKFSAILDSVYKIQKVEMENGCACCDIDIYKNEYYFFCDDNRLQKAKKVDWYILNALRAN